MDFSRRLRLFLIGVVLGSVIMYFYVLKDKNIYKSPKEVIKEKLLHFPLQLTTKAVCQIKCNNLDTAQLRKSWKNSEIDFGLSKVDEKPCPLYHFTLTPALGDTKIIECTVCDDFVVMQEIKETKEECLCN
jgi:hypothetical protein